MQNRWRTDGIREAPYATTGLNRIPDSVSDEQALFVGDILATGFWATRISEITEEDTVLIIGLRTNGYLLFALYPAQETTYHHCLREVTGQKGIHSGALSASDGCRT